MVNVALVHHLIEMGREKLPDFKWPDGDICERYGSPNWLKPIVKNVKITIGVPEYVGSYSIPFYLHDSIWPSVKTARFFVEPGILSQEEVLINFNESSSIAKLEEFFFESIETIIETKMNLEIWVYRH